MREIHATLPATLPRLDWRRVALVLAWTAAVVYLVAWLLSEPFAPQALGVDASAYWGAAERLRDGQALYPLIANQGAGDVYRYAPWFAFAWVPLTYLPRETVMVSWTALSLAAGAYLLVPLVRRRSMWLMVAFVVPWTVQQAWIGNVGTLMVASLVWGLDRRSGPVWVGLAASLKITPLAFAGVYLARREYRRTAVAAGIGAGLWAMLLAFDTTYYPTSTQGALPVPLPVWALLAGGMLAALAWSIRTGRHARLTAALVAIFAAPRLHMAESLYLIVGVRRFAA